MLTFRLADLPRTVRRLTPPLPLAADAAAATGAGAARGAWVEWTLHPTLLRPRGEREKAQLAAVIALYDEIEGQPRSAVDALAPRIEEILGDYRLARCVERTIEAVGYHFTPPPRALPQEPVALRALCYRRAQERHGGYVPRGERGAFVAALAAELRTTAEQVEETMWADRPGAALLRAGPAPADPTTMDNGDVAAPAPLHAAHVIARYNAAAVATVLAASSWVTLSLRASETTALKDLYRHAKAVHVGVEIALRAPARGEPDGGGDSDSLLAVTLFGPGSRALVRGRRVRRRGGAGRPDGAAAGGAGPAAHDDSLGEPLDEPADRADARSADRPLQAEPDGAAGDLAVPAPGGLPVAAIVARLARHHPRTVQEASTCLLGPDGRLFHVPLDEALLTALRAGSDADADTGAGDGDMGTDAYDSAVEADFARAFRAAAAAGRLGVALGWSIEREPRAVLVDGSVFLPDFSFRRGDVEVLCEVIGYYTEDYLERKGRKLAHLRGQIPLLLIVDRERASLFSASGFPVVTYPAGRQISVAAVVRALDTAFDPFARRRARAARALAALCAAPGPRLTEEELCAGVGCAGLTELTMLWSDLLAAAHGGADGDMGTGAGAMSGANGDAEADAEAMSPEGQHLFPRRYVPGYGLVSADTVAHARDSLARLMHGAGGSVALETAVACCERAGLADADDALIAALGGVVVRSGLFAAAQVYPVGDDAEQALATALSASSPGRRRGCRA